MSRLILRRKLTPRENARGETPVRFDLLKIGGRFRFGENYWTKTSAGGAKADHIQLYIEVPDNQIVMVKPSGI